MKHFFVSYTGADQQWAEWIAWQLENAGFSVAIQAWDFRPGSNFVLEMQRAASEAERTIAVLSPNFLASRFTQPEWAAAFAQDPTGEKGTLVPVRIRECDIEGLLRGIVYIDLVGADQATAKQKLLDGVKRGRVKPATAPAFPARVGGMTPPLRFPGALPSIWNLPFLRNPNFTGRAELLQQLRAALTSGATTALTQAIHGLGGVGKTQLAVEYAYRFTADYDIVWFVRAETTASIASDLALLAQPLQLPERDARDQNIVVQAVRDYLRQRDRWLVIFDNAEEPKDVRPFLPSFDYAQDARRHVLITSRNPVWGATAHTLDVQVLPRDQAIEFLLARTGHPPLSRTGEGWGGGDLADALGCLPLALEQAGAYIETNGKTLAEYLQLYRTHQRELLNRPPATDYPATVATTWEISFQQIEQLAPASAGLLNLLAFFAPDAIPKEIIVAGADHLKPQRPKGLLGMFPPKHSNKALDALRTALANPLEFDRATAVLRRYSLLQVGDATFSMHRLVQAVARDRMGDDTRKQWAEAAVQIIDDAFPSGDFQNDPATWNLCARLLPHALATAGYAAALEVALEAAARQFTRAGVYQRVRAQFVEAKQLHERAIAIDEVAFGPNHPEVATDVNNLGEVLRNLGDLAGARKCYERALKIDETAFGPNHPKVAIRVNNLGLVLLALGDLAGARAALERVVKIFEANLGANHPNVAIAINNLGSVLYDLGDLAGARTAFERALKIDETTFGPNHPNTATAVNNLGLVLQALGDLAGARQCYERALTIDEAAFGPNHPNVAIRVNNLGGVLQALGDLAGAHTAFERALKIWEASLGAEHPNVATAVNNLGSVLQALGDLAGARKCYERALKIFTQFLPENHPYIKSVRENLEAVEKKLGQRTSAD